VNQVGTFPADRGLQCRQIVSFDGIAGGSKPLLASTGMRAHKVDSVWMLNYESNQRSNNHNKSL